MSPGKGHYFWTAVTGLCHFYLSATELRPFHLKNLSLNWIENHFSSCVFFYVLVWVRRWSWCNSSLSSCYILLRPFYFLNFTYAIFPFLLRFSSLFFTFNFRLFFPVLHLKLWPYHLAVTSIALPLILKMVFLFISFLILPSLEAPFINLNIRVQAIISFF